jgi:hypothetical protein
LTELTEPTEQNAFTLVPGRCYRFITLPGVGHPMHGTEPVAWPGKWRSPSGKVYWIEACAGHTPADAHVA